MTETHMDSKIDVDKNFDISGQNRTIFTWNFKNLFAFIKLCYKDFESWANFSWKYNGENQS